MKLDGAKKDPGDTAAGERATNNIDTPIIAQKPKKSKRLISKKTAKYLMQTADMYMAGVKLKEIAKAYHVSLSTYKNFLSYRQKRHDKTFAPRRKLTNWIEKPVDVIYMIYKGYKNAEIGKRAGVSAKKAGCYIAMLHRLGVKLPGIKERLALIRERERKLKRKEQRNGNIIRN